MKEARKWFKENFKDDKNKIYTSKYYTSEESWPKSTRANTQRSVWLLKHACYIQDKNKKRAPVIRRPTVTFKEE